MALIQTISPEEATGRVQELYENMKKIASVVPKPFQLMSASPDLLSLMFQGITYFTQKQQSFSPLLLTHIRLLVANKFDYQYCTMFNSSILQMVTDISEEQLENLKKDPTGAALNDKEKALLLFVLKAVEKPASVEQKDVDDLRALGWTDKEILEATNYGADMVRHGILFKAFKMDME